MRGFGTFVTSMSVSPVTRLIVPTISPYVATLVPQLQITSVQQANGELIVTWTGGKPPYQIQTRPDFSPAAWQNLGATIPSTTAHIPASNSKSLFVRVSGQ